MTAPPAADIGDASLRAALPVWIAAALGAAVLHAVAVALAVAHFAAVEPEDALGAPAIEIDVEPTAPRAEPSDLPPGPEADASAASPAVAEQKTEPEQTELPTARPTETDDPDRLVAPTPSEKPEKEDPKVRAVQTAPSTESVAAEATATPTSETMTESARSAAPVQGTGESAQRVRVTWQKQLIAHLDRHKRYPADRPRKAAEILVSFALDRTGHVVSATIVKGSGDPAFDEAALAMLKRSDPVPAPPPLVADEGLSFTLPVLFRVKH